MKISQGVTKAQNIPSKSSGIKTNDNFADFNFGGSNIVKKQPSIPTQSNPIKRQDTYGSTASAPVVSFD